MFYATHSNRWYQFTCKFHTGCERVSIEKANESFKQITSFLVYKNKLDSRWTKFEKTYFKNLRKNSGTIIRLLLIFSFCFLFLINKKRIRYASSIILLSSLFVLFFYPLSNHISDILFKTLTTGEIKKNGSRTLLDLLIPKEYYNITFRFILLFAITTSGLFYLLSLSGKVRRGKQKRIVSADQYDQ